jgi:hypothetical protein
MTFRPVADGYVIAKDMRTLFETGKFNDTPVLLGHTSDETAAFGGRGPAPVLKPADFEKQMKDQFGTRAAAVIAAYPHATDADAARATRHVRNDTSFAWNMWTWARDQSKYGKGKVYSYYYNNHAPQAEGSGHGSDVSFHFQTLRTPASKEEQALSDLMGGQIPVSVQSAPAVLPTIHAGRVRALAVTSAARLSQLPGVPTVHATALPGFEVSSWYRLCAPAGTPTPVVDKVHADRTVVLQLPERQQRFKDLVIEVTPTGRDEFAQFIRAETARWARVIKEAGIPQQ